MLAERVDRVGLAGNPETLTPTVIERLLLQCHSFQFSVDGIEETHDWFRYPGNYLLTIKKIKEASQMGLRIHVMTTVSKRNLSQLPEIMKSVYEAGARHWEFSRYIPPVGQIQDLPDPMEYRSMMNKVHQLHQYYESNCGKKKLHKDPLWYPFANESPCLADNPDGCILGGCGLGTTSLAILPDNTIMNCRRHAGSILGKWQSAGDIHKLFFESPIMKKFRDIKNINRCNQCAYLYHCRGCRAVGYSVRGNIFDPDPTCSFFEGGDFNATESE